MAKNIEEIIERLLKISNDVLDEFSTLGALSYQDEEKTSAFDYHIKKTTSLLDTEAVIINNLTLSELCHLFILLPKYDDNSYIYERTFTRIEDHIEELYNSEVASEEMIDELEMVFEYELGSDSTDGVSNNLISDKENAKYDDLFTNYINIFALKRMRDRIEGTVADNKHDANFKLALLRQLKIFKYLILSQNNMLERMGLKYRFDVAKMPYIEMPDIDTSTLSYNHCVSIINKMYHPYVGNDDADTNTLNLFNMICFEAYLNHVNRDKLYKLVSICDEFRETTKNPFYGDIAKSKILTKSK